MNNHGHRPAFVTFNREFYLCKWQQQLINTGGIIFITYTPLLVSLIWVVFLTFQLSACANGWSKDIFHLFGASGLGIWDSGSIILHDAERLWWKSMAHRSDLAVAMQSSYVLRLVLWFNAETRTVVWNMQWADISYCRELVFVPLWNLC